MLLSSPVETSAEFDEVLTKLENCLSQLHRCHSLDAILECGVQQTQQIFGCDRALIYQFVDNGDGAVTAESVMGEWAPILGQLIYDPCFELNWGAKFRRGEITAIADVERADLDPCYVDLMRRLQVRANLVSPILLTRSLTGPQSPPALWGLLIVHQCSGAYPWRNLHRRVIQRIASQLGLAIQNFQVTQALGQANRDRRQWQEALEAAQYGVWDWNIPAERLALSPQGKAILGYAEPALDNSVEAWEALIHPNDRERVRAAIAQHWAQETPVCHCEYRLRNQAGQWQWVVSQGKVIHRRSDGTPLRFIGLMGDISDRYALDQELCDSQNRLLTVLEHSRASIANFWLLPDLTFRPRYYSPGSITITGYAPEDFWADESLWLSRIPPEDVTHVIQPAIDAIAAGQTQLQLEYRFRHRDGSIIWLQESLSARWEAAENCWDVTSVAMDISDRKAVEARLRQQQEDFRSLVENNPDGILRVDRQCRFLYVNPMIESRIGLSRAELLGRSFVDVGMPAAIGQRWEATINQVFETGQEQLLETEETLLFGEHIFYSRIVPEFDDQGQINSALIISRDMSNLRAAQEALQQRADQEHTLRLITQHMRETLDLNAILATAVTEVQQALTADRTLIFQLTSDHSGVVIQESVRPEYPVTLAMRWEDEYFSPDCYEFYRQGQGRIVEDVTQDDWGACLTDFMQSVGVQSKMVAPIIQNQPDGTVRVWGLMIVHACTTRRQWQPNELGLLQQVADQLAIAIQQSELHQRLQAANRELERISITDALTQIANRRCFDDTLEKEWQRVQREQRELTLIFCDIDYFKQYNDTYGHPAGDDCIYAVAQALQSCINRPTDCIARYGGEEFAVILPHTNIAGAIVIVQNMQAAIAQLEIAHQSHEQADRITLSFGITAVTPYPAMSVQRLIAQADQALYQAKQSGRNCYAVFTADDSAS